MLPSVIMHRGIAIAVVQVEEHLGSICRDMGPPSFPPGKIVFAFICFPDSGSTWLIIPAWHDWPFVWILDIALNWLLSSSLLCSWANYTILHICRVKLTKSLLLCLKNSEQLRNAICPRQNLQEQPRVLPSSNMTTAAALICRNHSRVLRIENSKGFSIRLLHRARVPYLCCFSLESSLILVFGCMAFQFVLFPLNFIMHENQLCWSLR